jgi:hypothetical protein
MPLNRVALVAPLVLAAAVAAETPVPQGAGGRGVGPGAAVGGAPRTGTALMVGRVVEGTTDRTVSEAIVQVIGAGAQAQRVITDADGPGEYLLAAVTDLRPDDEYNPAFLDVLAKAAVKITLKLGERAVQNLQIAR